MFNVSSVVVDDNIIIAVVDESLSVRSSQSTERVSAALSTVSNWRRR